MPETDIFISYAREDREIVRRLANALAQKGWSVWWDTDIHHGQNYRSSIKKALEQAGCVIVVWSQYSVDSDWVLDEAGYGYRKNILVPVTIGKGIDPPLGFGGIQTADLTPWLEDTTQTTSFDHLCRDIAALLGEPGAPPQGAPPVVPQGKPATASEPAPHLRRWGVVLCLSAILAANLYFIPRSPMLRKLMSQDLQARRNRTQKWLS